VTEPTLRRRDPARPALADHRTRGRIASGPPDAEIARLRGTLGILDGNARSPACEQTV